MVALAPTHSPTPSLAAPATPRCSLPGGQRLCRIYTKGASEIVLERCSSALGPDGVRRRLTEGEKQALLAEFSQGGQR